MYHIIEFTTDWYAEVEHGPGEPVTQVLLRRGTRWRAEARPRILETGPCPIEAADLQFEDGSVARGVRYSAFTFVDEPAGKPAK